MKNVMSYAPTFAPASRTLDFSGYSGFALKSLVAVINQTKKVVIYAPAKGIGFGYAAFASNVLTLDFDTTPHAAGDVLEILYDATGQDTMGRSASVAIASDQTPVPMNLNFTIFQYSAAGVNSSVTQLAAAATFTGAIESIPNQPDYSILVFSDQNASITVNQYIDATSTFKVYTRTYTYTANGQFQLSMPANGNYFQIIVQNTGGSTTTLLNINVAYGVIRSSTVLNNAPVAVCEINGTSIDANSGNKSAGSQRVVIATDDVNLSAINTKTPALGQAAAASSTPVTLSNENVQDLYVTGQSAQTATVNNILTATAGTAATDIQQYRSFAIQVVSTGTAGGFIFEGSNDNISFQTVPVVNQASIVPIPVAAAITPTASSIIYIGACNFRYIRCRVSTAITGGSIQAFSTFTQTPFAATSLVVGQGTAANLNVTATGTITASNTAGTAAHSAATSGNPVYVAGKAVPITTATVDTTITAGDATGLPATTGLQVPVKPFGTAELDVTNSITTVATVVTLQPLILASGTASVRNYLASLIISSDALGTAGTVFVLDGQGAIGTSVTIATPGVFTSTAHDLKVGDAIVFTSLGTITGVSVNTQYYITATSFAATTFTIATTLGGTAIAITGATAAFTFYRVLYPIKLQTAAMNPIVIPFATPLRSMANMAINLLIPSSLTSGNIYVTANGYRGF